MVFRKCSAVVVTIVFGSAPTLALAQDKAALTFNMPEPVPITKGTAFAYSLCTNTEVPAAGQGATGGFACTRASGAAQGGCPPYSFRLAGASEAGFNKFLPPGVFLERNGVIHGTVKSIGVLTRTGGVICVEDSCGSTPSCKELELKPVNPDTRTLTSEKATLGQVAGASEPEKSPFPEADARFDPDAAAPSGGTQEPDAEPKKKGGGAGTAVLATLGVAAAVAGGLALASAAADASAGGCSVTRSQCCSGSGSGCGIPPQCQCPGGLFDGGICQAGRGCSNFVTPGNRTCNGC